MNIISDKLSNYFDIYAVRVGGTYNALIYAGLAIATFALLAVFVKVQFFSTNAEPFAPESTAWDTTVDTVKSFGELIRDNILITVLGTITAISLIMAGLSYKGFLPAITSSTVTYDIVRPTGIHLLWTPAGLLLSLMGWIVGSAILLCVMNWLSLTKERFSECKNRVGFNSCQGYLWLILSVIACPGFIIMMIYKLIGFLSAAIFRAAKKCCSITDTLAGSGELDASPAEWAKNFLFYDNASANLLFYGSKLMLILSALVLFYLVITHIDFLKMFNFHTIDVTKTSVFKIFGFTSGKSIELQHFQIFSFRELFNFVPANYYF